MWRYLFVSSCVVALTLAASSDVSYFPNSCDKLQHIFHLTKDLPTGQHCPQSIAKLRNTIYLLYDVNPPEGFNLRRDVYIRLAVFVRQLASREPFQNIRLVLPPWRRLYHWKSSHLEQHSLPWELFFDVESMRRYAPVLDFPEFLEEIAQFGLQEPPYVQVQKVFQLLNFEDMFEQGVFHEKFQFEHDCRKEQYLHGYLLQQPMLLDNDFACVRYQGSVNLLERVLRHELKNNTAPMANDVKVYAILNAEIVLHDQWGDREFWRARRSMRFAEPLQAIAEEYRERILKSDKAIERIQRPPMWESEREYQQALGGDYLAVHFRRGDFVHWRQKSTPTLKSAATQIRAQLQLLNLTTVYIATDTTAMELTNLKAYLQRIRVRRFTPESLTQKALIKDGGLAIVDQIICAHARHFMGTFESTFTYRIYEEREILGFPQHTTFNTLCKYATLEDCEKNSVWSIVY
ncbi:GDP-fucose protein O-fucosyltransferase 2 [Zeugodacus cucurbitae]|uniref:GDP-fucose protein O-fucosyltransferase 2 n=1 Tax=Zeugodacus cucurbitae TaxID=28588 RepID=A0A0A1WW97_ZEUCU|nr:GDP-fucose protein O-fucosyltransferase 2 [Zeugodacus cucurbitae]